MRFWFTPSDATALHVVRLATGLLLLAWLLPFAGQVNDVFGLNGWLDIQAYREAAAMPGGPPVPYSWSIIYLCGRNATLLMAVYWLSIAVLALFAAGVWTRITSALSWVVVCSFTASPALAADADTLLQTLSFYLMLGYLFMGLGDSRQPLVSRLLGAKGTFLLGRKNSDDERGLVSLSANLAMRLLQVHFAILVVTSGLHKLQFGDWWSGAALWYPLHPILELTANAAGKPEDINSSLAWVSIAAYAMLAWEIAFPAFAWRRRWRAVHLTGSAVAWLGCIFVYRIPVYGPAFFVGCLSYVTAQEWHRYRTLLEYVPGIQRFVPGLANSSEQLIPQGTR
jgi:hypothetical protein